MLPKKDIRPDSAKIKGGFQFLFLDRGASKQHSIVLTLSNFNLFIEKARHRPKMEVKTTSASPICQINFIARQSRTASSSP